MNRLSPFSKLLGVALFTVSCMGDRAPDSVVIGELSGSGLSATIALSSDWGGGYCANVTVTNTGASAITTWQVVINLNQSTAAAPWSATGVTSGSQMTNGPLAWNAAIAPGGTASYGFCATATGTNYHPTLVSVGGGSGGGTTGAAGTNGAAGTRGAAGTMGAAGTNGAAGTRGAAGTMGAAGTTGKAGTTGA